MEENLDQDLGVLIQRRHQELSELKKKGIEPFAYSYDVNSDSDNIKTNFKEDEKRIVRIAGRIMAIRRMGKASFAHIQDCTGRIQIYLKKDDLGENYDVFKLLDIGDIIGIEGYVFKTKTGEISVHTNSLTLLAKSLRPLPIPKETTDEAGNKIIHDQFSDKELRYRQRYLDLVVNPDVREVFMKRSKIISSMRKFLDYYEFGAQFQGCRSRLYQAWRFKELPCLAVIQQQNVNVFDYFQQLLLLVAYPVVHCV